MAGLSCIAPNGAPIAAGRASGSALATWILSKLISTPSPGLPHRLKPGRGGKRITPTFDIDGKIIIDFDEKKLTEALQDRLSPTTP